jgi:chemotaxis protein histidine kinase CheA
VLGVGQGVFTAETLFFWRSCKRLYLVDPYSTQQQPASAAAAHNAPTKQQQDQQEKDQRKQQEEDMQQAHENLQGWQEKLLWLRNTTTVAARHIREPLDYVYLDSSRDYCSVLEALEAWWPLVRPGGVMGGHSYENAVDVMRQSGQDWSRCADGSTVHQGAVQAAVNDFFEQQGVQIVVTYREHMYNSWLVRKPYYPCNSQEAAGEGHEPLTELLSKMLQQAPQQPGQLQQLETKQQQQLQQEQAQEQDQKQEQEVPVLQEQQQEVRGAQLVQEQQTADDAVLLPRSASDAQQQVQQQTQQQQQERLQQQQQQEQQQAALLKLHDTQALASSRARHAAEREAAGTGQQADNSHSSGGGSGDVFGDILSEQHHEMDH